MGWIGLADGEGQRFDARGLQRAGDSTPTQPPANALLPCGTILVETRLSPDVRPRALLEFAYDQPFSGGFSLQALPGGAVILVDSQDGGVRHATLRRDPDTRADVARISYSWDAPRRYARLVVERPEANSVSIVEMAEPTPMLLADLRRMICRESTRNCDPENSFVAVSDRMEPVGPMPGLASRLPVDSARGTCEARRLRFGDTVKCPGEGLVPVLQPVRRTVPARGSFRPVLLRAPYFGLSRDILVAPQQRLVMCGAQVEYLFGHEAVLVAAGHLVNGVSARRATGGPDLITYHQVVLPGHEALKVAGCAVESLYIGRLRRRRDDLAASVLAGAPRSDLPEHPKPVWPVLKPFEAITLAAHRAA